MGSNLPADMQSSSLTRRPREKSLYCTRAERGFPIHKLDHVGQLSHAAGALSINLSFETPVHLLKRSKKKKKARTIKIALDMLRPSQRGKREVWHALLNPVPLFAFDSKSHNDIQVLTKLRNEAATEGEKWR